MSQTLQRPCQNETQGYVQQEESDKSRVGPGGIANGAHTSEYYRCQEMPQRFDNPDWFRGYGAKQTHPMYRTTNAEYGSKAPSVHTMQTAYHTLSQEFTKDLGKCGMFRNHSLNCSTDKSVVPEF